jgi:hypothetical protein
MVLLSIIYFLFLFMGWEDTESTWYNDRPLLGLLFQAQMMIMMMMIIMMMSM